MLDIFVIVRKIDEFGSSFVSKIKENLFYLWNIEIRSWATVRKHTQITIQNTCFSFCSFLCSVLLVYFVCGSFQLLLLFFFLYFSYECEIYTLKRIRMPIDRPNTTLIHNTANTTEYSNKNLKKSLSVFFPSSSLFF